MKNTFYKKTVACINKIHDILKYHSLQGAEMKTKLTIAIAFLIITQLCGQWEWQSPFPPTIHEFEEIKFFNDNDGFVIDRYGTCFITSTGGKNWEISATTPVFSSFDLSFIDNLNGILIGGNVIQKTENGGWNWNQQPRPGGNSYFYACHIFDHSTIYLAGEDWYQSNPRGAFFLTTNGGDSWTKITQFGVGTWLSDLHFFNKDTGYVVAYDKKVYKTSNGGYDWSLMFTANVSLKSIDFSDSNNGIIRGGIIPNWAVYTTSDAGQTWPQVNKPDDYIIDIEFYNHDLLLAAGIGYSVYKSTDQGTNWTNLLRLGLGTGSRFNTISVLDTNTFLVAGSVGAIYKTDDGGINWQSLTNGTKKNLIAVDMLNSGLGFAVGEEGAIVKTSDGGDSWFEIETSYTNLFDGISIVNESTSLAIAYEGLVIKTTDGGVTWQEKLSGLNYNLTEIQMITPNYGFISGSGGNLIKTTDGGENWLSIGIDTSLHVLNICVFDSLNIFVTTKYNIYRSQDGGNNWILLYSDSPANFSSINKMGNSGIIVTGSKFSESLILKSSDMGNNWIEVPSPVTGIDQCVDASFIDSNNGLICFWDGDIYRTSDGGETWVYEANFSPCYTKQLTDIQMLGYNDAVAVGYCGTIVSTMSGGTTNSDEEIIINSEFSLSQNYPNPFNPITKIKYTIPSVIANEVKQSLVTLKVYDVLGREVATLVDEYKPAGSYEVEFLGNGLSSGIYFYRLKTDGFVETKKMLLIK